MRRAKRRRSFNLRIFRSRRAYTFADIAEELETHIRTVQRWHKEGLPVVDDTTPYLIMGYAIQTFLKERGKRRKTPLKPGEFYCPRCRAPRLSAPEKLVVERTSRRLGKVFKQVLIRGICCQCRQRLLLFSSDRKLAEWLKIPATSAEQGQVLNGSLHRSVNTDMPR